MSFRESIIDSAEQITTLWNLKRRLWKGDLVKVDFVLIFDVQILNLPYAILLIEIAISLTDFHARQKSHYNMKL